MEQQFSNRDTITNITEDKPQDGLSDDDIFARVMRNKIHSDNINREREKKEDDQRLDLRVNKDKYDRILLIKHITDIKKRISNM